MPIRNDRWIGFPERLGDVVNKGFSGVVALPKTSGVSIMRHLMDCPEVSFPGAGHGPEDSAGMLLIRMIWLTGNRRILFCGTPARYSRRVQIM